MSNTQFERSRPTGLDALEEVVTVFAGDEMFLRGFGAGIESETLLSREANEFRTDSPITLLAEMNAWEGSHRLRGHEQDFRYSIGAVVGAFATRSGVDIYEFYDRIATPAPQN